MRFIILAVFAMISAVMADGMVTVTTKFKLANGAACKQDGSIGICTSNFCLQTPDEATGVCSTA
ncbi:hypothetical protein N7466_002332 [Penicillium verhagenii]|uniref:uncharacterized protein n=1 Tax=Penicillium verhagenii TaxID=1562060 RepID=UPI002545920C|nr:uncharacterized protein N7466_002332 [Penicillium verhagenii]KAJ5939198.1 hypothetical protein N7466_002332 [Penicillium verhagenii]